MPRKLYLETFGCQMNVLDSELVLGQLRAQGYQSVEDPDSANVILYNTCSVREHAENKVWSRLGQLRDRKKSDPSLVIGVIGCLAERDGTNLFKKHPHVDLLCGPGELDKLQSLLHNAVLTNSPPSSLNPEPRTLNRQIALMGNTTRRSSTLSAAEDNLELLDLSRSISSEDNLAQAYVRITRGCNKFCTYCVVPYTRGPEVHRPPQNIIDEVKRLTDAGVKEVTLLGQTINHYHYKPESGGTETTFADLLYQIHEAVPHLPRLRFVTSFPRDFTDLALQAMRDCNRICRYLHVPAQHGSDRILKMMNRGYTAQQYRDFIDRARAYMPDLSIASDFIVGFPTETEAEFQTCIDIIQYCRFKNSFIFKYSPRPGTTAIDRFPDDIPDDIKRRRNNELLAVQQQVCTANNLEMVGKTLEVMVEGQTTLASKKAYPSSNVELAWESRQSSPLSGRPTGAPAPLTQLTGRTRGDQVVAFPGPLSLRGQLLPITITSAKSLTLFGHLAPTPALT
ncbi:MAG TPA: tRNA (N6-isopentenyl adenosine(37)-C2)-methylthiotransferase MiaB [Tepidisphaeraceae bacterium]|jgi:tRNA-2-methylthio-N6-dimethylallyladenosine synthase|nr:tRNA (N6-isopentenyl adenosine(37)-C2)-methylthiotransferase MiaB [Tepidisphaeraceae bacterium]